MNLTEHANSWIADSADDTLELREAAEIIGLLLNEVERLAKQLAHDRLLYEEEGWYCSFIDVKKENAALKLQLSGRTYCHSDEAVEAVEAELKTIRTICGELPELPAKASTVQLVENIVTALIKLGGDINQLEKENESLQDSLLYINLKHCPQCDAAGAEVMRLRGAVMQCYQIASSHEFGPDAAKTIRETFGLEI